MSADTREPGDPIAARIVALLDRPGAVEALESLAMNDLSVKLFAEAIASDATFNHKPQPLDNTAKPSESQTPIS